MRNIEHFASKTIDIKTCVFLEHTFAACVFKLQSPVVQKVYNAMHWINPRGGGTATYGLYRYVPLLRVWFSSSLLWDRVYKSERLGLE